MDSLTHIASGALIGEAVLGKTLGKRAMWIGAALQSLPDIDVVASFWLNPTDDLLAHRGFTHSFLFAVLASVLTGLIAVRTHRQFPVPFRTWVLFFLLEIATHLFLDAFNNYGVGWLEPFSHARFSFNTIFVLDPFYSLPLVIPFIALLILKRSSVVRKRWVQAGLLISTLYLLYAVSHKISIDKLVRKNVADQHIVATNYFTTPTVFNNWLWYVVVEDSMGFSIGYRSVFDAGDRISFQRVPQQQGLLVPLGNRKDIRQLIRFSRGFFTVETRNDTLIFNDLRFGQIAGWTHPGAPFVFHYYLNHPAANTLVVQRGRFEGWNSKSISEFITRIKGNE